MILDRFDFPTNGGRPMRASTPLKSSPAPGRAPAWSLRELTAAGLFAALTAVAAVITIPMPFVPFTLQVLVTLLSGAVLGARAGALSQAVYVLMGAIGLPVFAGRNGGVQALAGPTGGYLLGFILAAWVVGRLFERSSTAGPWRAMGAMALGLAAIHVPGVLVLSYHTGSLASALAVGAAFLPVDIVKAAGAYLLAKSLAAHGLALRAPAWSGPGEQRGRTV